MNNVISLTLANAFARPIECMLSSAAVAARVLLDLAQFGQVKLPQAECSRVFSICHPRGSVEKSDFTGAY